MNGGRLTIWIDGREALPVRAIPYVAPWKVASPEWIADYLAKGTDVPCGAIPLSAYQLINGAPVAVMSSEWDLPVAKIKGLVHALHEQRPSLSPMDDHAGYVAYQERAIDALPHSVFVWLDDFESAYKNYCERNHYGSAPLTLAPMAANEETTRAMVLKGFEGCPHRQPYGSRHAMLSGYWRKPWSELPDEQRQVWIEIQPGIAEADAAPWWEHLTPYQREYQAKTFDSQNDPAFAAERLVARYDGPNSMNAAMWFKRANIKPDEAAMLLCRINPLERDWRGDPPDPERTYADDDKAWPERYRVLLRVFEDIAETEPKPRSLLDWLDVARDEGLRYHGWIDEYLAAKDLMERGEAESNQTVGAKDEQPRWLKKEEIERAFGKTYGANNYWENLLSKNPESWIKQPGFCRKVGPGNKNGSDFNPIMVAEHLHTKCDVLVQTLNAAFKSETFDSSDTIGWREEWKRYCDSLD